MAPSHNRSPRLSLSRSVSRIRIRSPSLKCKPVSSPDEADQTTEFLKNNNEAFNGGNDGFGSGNKVMVVVDSRLDSKGALEWALSHTVQSQDTIVLLHVAKPQKQGAETNWKKRNVRAHDMLQSMKNICQLRRPGVQVEVSMVEGRQKGTITVEEAKQQKVSLLVLGQRKKSIMWRLMKRWVLGKKMKKKTHHEGEFVNYCIEYSSCMTIAVRRKGNKVGGYLITTKRHKNFWLLA